MNQNLKNPSNLDAIKSMLMKLIGSEMVRVSNKIDRLSDRIETEYEEDVREAITLNAELYQDYEYTLQRILDIVDDSKFYCVDGEMHISLSEKVSEKKCDTCQFNHKCPPCDCPCLDAMNGDVCCSDFDEKETECDNCQYDCNNEICSRKCHDVDDIMKCCRDDHVETK